MSRAKKILATLWLAGALHAPGASAECLFSYLHEKYEGADAIFTGRLIRKESVETSATDVGEKQYLTFETQQIFKGAPSSPLTVSVWNIFKDYQLAYQQDQEYLVFALLNFDGTEYTTDMCAGTQPLSAQAVDELEAAIQALDSGGTYISRSPYLSHTYEVPLENRRINGIVNEYGPDGKLISSKNYADGALKGTSAAYDSEGRMTSQTLYQH